jgi:hypothetical protein
MIYRTVLVLVGIVVGASCDQQPVSTRSIVGRWEFVRANNIVGQGASADGMHIGFLITNVRGDSVFGKAYMYSPLAPLSEDACGALRGVHTDAAHFSLSFITGHPPFDVRVEGTVRRDSLFISEMRSAADGNIVPLGAWLVYARRSEELKGCLTRA